MDHCYAADGLTVFALTALTHVIWEASTRRKARENQISRSLLDKLIDLEIHWAATEEAG